MQPYPGAIALVSSYSDMNMACNPYLFSNNPTIVSLFWTTFTCSLLWVVSTSAAYNFSRDSNLAVAWDNLDGLIRAVHMRAGGGMPI